MSPCTGLVLRAPLHGDPVVETALLAVRDRLLKASVNWASVRDDQVVFRQTYFPTAGRPGGIGGGLFRGFKRGVISIEPERGETSLVLRLHRMWSGELLGLVGFPVMVWFSSRELAPFAAGFSLLLLALVLIGVGVRRVRMQRWLEATVNQLP
ncbi:hypothetical protein SGCZBJ_05230 [Caulobacter zeae]|uniref:Uncharacterized protein n=1 Tax=Caulobacter zeae TaxID=2055137 RepID=A0A2N5DNX3_9CAUL|nr:hypothetical protein [Caulobacter zeae]PLR27763.1 hypothetical protein SGCZBJ_05230 [Caulobacter zeae]